MTAVSAANLAPGDDVKPSALGRGWLVGAVGSLVLVMVVAIAVGPVSINPVAILVDLIDHLPFVSIDAGLSRSESVIVNDLRLPRVVLGALVGSLLGITGGAYQGAFRNPLADPFLLGIAAGAGLGATLAIIAGAGSGQSSLVVPIAAFAGALVAVALSFGLGHVGGGSTISLVLAGVAVASFLTALQTFVLQRNNDVILEVYSWLLGRLSTAGWADVRVLLPYFAITMIVVLRYRGALDVLAVGDDEARTLGIDPRRVRIIVVLAASLGAAAAVSVSGLIGFVGIIVPHAVRLVVGVSNRLVLPLSAVLGGTFMVAADLIARTVMQPIELPIGVVTAFFGAPFFALLLRQSTQESWS